MHQEHLTADVLVVGAGPAGLTARRRSRGSACRPSSSSAVGALELAARHRGQHPVDGDLPLLGPGRADPRWWPRRRAGCCGRARPSPTRPPDPVMPSGTRRGAGRCAQPDRPGVRAAGPPRAGTAGPPARTALREGRTRRRGGRCPRRNGRRTGDTARRRDRRDACRDAAYLVAADGAHSAVRRAVGLPMHGPDRLAAAATALFRAPLWELLGTHRYGIYGVDHPEGRAPSSPAETTAGCTGSNTTPTARGRTTSRSNGSPG